jgi:DNA-binding NarL/FixJ family response regulator
MRVLVIDDHLLFGAGLIAAVQQHASDRSIAVQIVSATNLQDGLELAMQFGPDVLLLDYYLPDTSGLQLLQIFASRFPWTARVVMSGDQRAELIAAARANGASGFIAKTQAVDTVWLALQAVANGQEWWPDAAAQPASQATRPAGTDNQLTPRQSQVLHYINQGMSNREIGHMLSIAERTVKQHMSDLLAKTQATNRESLLQTARSKGWVL